MAGPGSLWLLLLEVPQAGSSCAVQTPGARSSPTETPGLTRAAAGNSLEPGGILLKAEDATPCSQSKEAAFEYTVLGLDFKSRLRHTNWHLLYLDSFSFLQVVQLSSYSKLHCH